MPQQPDSIAVKATLMLASMLTVMAGATIAPSLPAMRDFFGEVPNADYWVRLVLTTPALLIALGAPIVGVIIDRFGRKPLLMLAICLYGLAGSSGFFLNSLGLILIGRALLGLSVAGIMTTATTLIADYYSGSTRARFLGLQGGFMGLGGVVFLSLGGFLADLNWRFPFLIYLSALLILPLGMLVLPEPSRVITQTAGAADPEPFPTQWVALTYGIAFIQSIVFYLVPTQLPFYLQQLFQAGGSQSGLAIALTTLCSAISSIFYQPVKARLSFVSIYGIAFSSMGVGYLLISLGGSYGIVLLGLAFAGFGLGLLMPNMTVCLTSISPASQRGKVLGGQTTAMFMGQFLSPLISQPISQAVGLGKTYGYGGGLVLILAVIAWVSVLRSNRTATL